MSRFLDTPRNIAEKLAQRVEDVCRELLPNGKREGHEWRCGSTDGDTGKSLGVHLSGNKAGVWADFASGEGGDLLDLWVEVRRCPMGQAMGEARGFLGISVPTFERTPKTFKRPAKPKCNAPKSAVREYLAARGLSDAALKAYSVGERGNTIVFPFLRDGVLLLAKEREAVDGAKPKPTEGDCEKTAFGWQAIPADAREVVITEGEIDAISSWEMAAPALSVPFGGGGGNKQDWVENDFDHLARFDVIYLATDNDGPGDEAAVELAKRIGPERCRRVMFPAGIKDANELLKTGFTGEDWLALLRAAKSLDPAELRRASDYTDEIIAQFYPPEGGAEVCYETPWPKLTEELRFRPGEVCVLQGINGHGKTELAGNIVAQVVSRGGRACIASMEFKPRKWLARLCRQVSGIERPTEQYIRDIAEWWHPFLWAFDVTGKAKSERILSVFEYAARRHRVGFFVIDNLAKCGFDEDDYNGQKDFVDKLTDLSRELDIFIMLVCHPKKVEDESKAPGKMDVKGSGAITDMVDTVLSIWRNKAKHEKIERMVAANQSVPDDLQNLPDAVLACHKQRNGESEPKMALWFDRASHQFLQSPKHAARQYVSANVAPIRNRSAA